MPAKSKKQFKFMEAVKNGTLKEPGLSPQKASEFVDNVSYRSLPRQMKKMKKERMK